jgi:N-acetylglucosamine-6-phosphate deacetylase
MKKITVFSGGTIITPKKQLLKDLVVENGVIKEIREQGEVKNGEELIDCRGMFVGPGLVDIHVHGGAGNDFIAIEAEEIIRGVHYHLSQGTTSITPTALSVPWDELEASIKAAMLAAKGCNASILGYHIEGIYLDHEFRGGHLDEYLHNPDPEEYEPLIEKYGDFITEWTLAPELPGAIKLIKACKKAGIVTSAGHSQATYEQMIQAVENGLSHSTHFACVMGTLRFAALRDSTGKGFAPGVMETILLDDRLTTEIIADGFHLHKGIIELALKCKGIDRVALVSDSMKGVGLPDGKYFIGGQDCIVEGGIALIKGRPEIIASSVTPLVGMLRFAFNNFGISLTDAWTMASLTPAKIIGFDKQKGSLSEGKDADILILDKDLNVKNVYVKGKKIIDIK